MASEPRIEQIEIRRLRLPLVTPYRLSYRTFDEFEPFLVLVRDDSGRTGFGEGHVSPGSSSETPEGARAFLGAQALAVTGLAPADAVARVSETMETSKVAATALITAFEMLGDHPLLRVDAPCRQALLTPTNASTVAAIEAEVEARLAEGFRTFKIKVGKDVNGDLERVRAYQRAAAGRAAIRIDANRAFSREDGCRFAAALDPDGIELFEQPCAAEDWDANAAVARASTVALMLDEPICAVADIERAAAIEGVGYCKLKLKRFGGLGRLERALRRVRELGMTPVLGDGLGAEPACWMEACVARTTIDNAGEFNGFLKPRARLFATPLAFRDGNLELAPGRPTLDNARLDEHTSERETFEPMRR